MDTDTDLPLFRLADVLLTYAEAVQRGGPGGSAATALSYVNQVRRRAYSQPLAMPNLTADVTAFSSDYSLRRVCRRQLLMALEGA